jgi:carbon-monoxide dehydrogenase large subunit
MPHDYPIPPSLSTATARAAAANACLVAVSNRPYAWSHAFLLVVSDPVLTKTNPLGAKGAGESGAVGALPAVMNAVNDALARVGATYVGMPATAEAIWRAIAAAKRRT